MLATDTTQQLHDDEDTHILRPGDEEPRFNVVVKPTDVEGTNYLTIDVCRTFKSTAEVNAWMSSCVARLTAELYNLMEADDEDANGV